MTTITIESYNDEEGCMILTLRPDDDTSENLAKTTPRKSYQTKYGLSSGKPSLYSRIVSCFR